jgi:hypothetical protein
LGTAFAIDQFKGTPKTIAGQLDAELPLLFRRTGSTITPSKTAADDFTLHFSATTQRSSIVPRITQAPCQRILCFTTAPSSKTQLSANTEYSSNRAPFSILQLLPITTG